MKLSEMQRYENYILSVLSKICDESGIIYFLNCGSVLGAVRHNGPIPWDSDTDIIIPYNQINLFCKECKKKLPEDLYFDFYTNNKYYYALFPRIGVKGYTTDRLHVDCFPLVGLPDEYEKQKKFSKKSDFLKNLFFIKKSKNKRLLLKKMLILPISSCYIRKKFCDHCNKYDFENSRYVMNPCGHYGIKNILSKEVFGAGKKVDYAGMKLRIPIKAEEYLTHYYGDYMKFPNDAKEMMMKDYVITVVK